eukprot:NODE_12066_length_1248_cov_3.080285.p8 GENE.NODE_12066_length_1248_cov_3.080285~~NODE_12066_length_1248_cov_3.080285.p8  ORF type:complete len:55 (-),score=17.92 NODE_12066_length_1248_cov_3.080285:789-953(-)
MGLKTLLAVLDKAFKKDDVDTIEETQDRFFHCRRAYGQDMDTYIMNMQTAWRRL